ncbi:MAG: bifunctional phosphopantothenoylcysteine decarboxylase/phosphopantothenate--cysteine ligase CoaBC [Thermoplasmata archaeon]
MHPSRSIRGRSSELLAGRRIILGIAGSIAATEVPRIARELIRHGADVQAVMSAEAQRLVTAEAVQFATGHPPVTQLTGDVEHVSLLGPGAGRADLLLIAPATANTIAKIAHGIDDTPVTSCASIALGGGVPVLLAPAMHEHMLQNPAVAEALAKLRRWGVGLVSSLRAEGEEKLATPEEIAAAVLHRLARGPWAGRSIVVIGGAARERIDAVRSITNESSGAMAVALCVQAHFRGAEVELWLGHHSVAIPPYLVARSWSSVADLARLADSERDRLPRAGAVIVPAALADFTLDARPGKIPSRRTPELTLRLRTATKILPRLRDLAPPPTLLVGFKLEAPGPAAELEASARRMHREAHLDWVVADDSSTMGSTEIRALVLPPHGARLWLQGSKFEVAGKLLDDIGRTLGTPVAPRTTGGRTRRRAKQGTRAPRRRS